MIDVARVKASLIQRYDDLEKVENGIFRGIDRLGGRDYAIRYFDLNDDLAETALKLRNYQENILSQTYFSKEGSTDLRWNHYLYFITSKEVESGNDFYHLKARIESDREYARKHVISEEDVARLFDDDGHNIHSSIPVDLVSTWKRELEMHSLGFILDDTNSVPKVVKRVSQGFKDNATHVTPKTLNAAELAATQHFIHRLKIKGFRLYPEQKEYTLGRVNLIAGSNGVGKTSLLEAIEYGYCGKTRRQTSVIDPTLITFDLLGADQKLLSTTDTRRLRARHANWYAVTEPKRVNIQNSFSKFNFLDTDAAVRLSVSTGTEQIGQEVARLMLGPAAEGFVDRLRRVLDKTQDEIKHLRRDYETHKTQRQESQDHIDAIKAASKLSDSLFLQLVTALEHQHWIKMPKDKFQMDTLRRDLQKAMSAIEYVRLSNVDVLQSGQVNSAKQFLTTMKEEETKVSTLEVRYQEARRKESEARQNAHNSEDLFSASEALIPYAQNDFERLVLDARTIKESVLVLGKSLALIVSTFDEASIEPYHDDLVDTAISIVEQQILVHEGNSLNAQSSLRMIEKTQNNLIVLRQRLISTAEDILKNSPNPDNCPLCRTEFDSGQLLTRIVVDFQDTTSEKAGRLRSEISTANKALDSARLALKTMCSLKNFLPTDANTVSVGEAILLLRQEQSRFDRLSSELEVAKRQIRQLQAGGLSSEELFSQLLKFGLTTLPPIEQLIISKKVHQEDLKCAKDTIEAAKMKILDVKAAYRILAEGHSIHTDVSGGELLRTIRLKITEVDAALDARHTLMSFLRISKDQTASDISFNLSSAQQQVAQVTTAIAQEDSNSGILEKEIKATQILSEKIQKRDKEIANLIAAESVFSSVSIRSSGKKIIDAMLAENAEEISRIFGSIHMPNEFEIKIDEDALSILRRRTGTEVQLDEMSSGQRAAFALSLFLAMNDRLQSGPCVILFDDPVAHVDDINVLSFLDHLRRIAISGSRQIFFATADTKLAGLFRHKFRFLGDNFKDIVLTRS